MKHIVSKEAAATPEGYREFVINRHSGLPTIFRLTRVATDKTLRHRGAKRYPKYKVYTSHCYLFNTLAEAEKRLSELVKEVADTDYYDITFCYFIYELPMGLNISAGALQYEGWESWRRYDADGRPEDRSYCAALEWNSKEGETVNPYWGRPEESLRFEEGEVVEVLHGDEVRLMVATSKGLGFEYYRKNVMEYYEEGNAEMLLPWIWDFSDDQIPCIDGPGYEWHDHISFMQLFKPYFKIPERTLAKYKRFYTTMLEKEKREAEAMGLDK